MHDVVKICAVCKQEIEINIHDIHDIARLKSKYYHPACLKEYAQKRVKTKKHDVCWDYAIGHICECEKDAREIIYKKYWQDLLNEHLLKHYDVITMPDRFWEKIMDLHNGVHKGKKCKPVQMETLCGTWMWGQVRLDSINRKNRQSRLGPKNDNDRLNYDLAIVLNHIEDYKKYVAKLEAEEAERAAREKERVKIELNDVYKPQEVTDGIGDLSEILDEFF